MPDYIRVTAYNMRHEAKTCTWGT